MTTDPGAVPGVSPDDVQVVEQRAWRRLLHHRLFMPGVAGVLVLALCSFSLIDDISYMPEVLDSARAAVGDMLTSLVVSLPLIAGLAAADAVLIMRGRSGLVGSLPSGARNRLLLRKAGLLWCGAAAGIAMACGVAYLATAKNGTPITAMTFVLVPYALLGLAAYACIGYAVGYWWQSWFAPPLLAVCGYVLGIGDDSIFLFAYNGMPPPWSLFQHPKAVSYGVVLLSLVGLAATAIVWLLALRTNAWKVAVCITSTACVCGLIVAGLAFDSSPDYGWTDDKHEEWLCHALPGGTQVCVPTQVPGDLALASAQLAPLVPQLLELDPALADAKWMPGSMAPGELSYELPMGRVISSWSQAQVAAFGLGQSCFEKWTASKDDTSEFVVEQLNRDAWVLSVWIAGSTADFEFLRESGGPMSVSLSVAKTLYTRLVECTY